MKLTGRVGRFWLFRRLFLAVAILSPLRIRCLLIRVIMKEKANHRHDWISNTSALTGFQLRQLSFPQRRFYRKVYQMVRQTTEQSKSQVIPISLGMVKDSLSPAIIYNSHGVPADANAVIKLAEALERR